MDWHPFLLLIPDIQINEQPRTAHDVLIAGVSPILSKRIADYRHYYQGKKKAPVSAGALEKETNHDGYCFC